MHKTVLLVDDEPDIRALLADELAVLGSELKCLEAANGRDALVLVRAQRPDLIITDLQMAQGDGLALLRSVRDEEPHLPVIVVTAFGVGGNVYEAWRAGAFDFITKPLDPGKLVSSVKIALLEGERFLRQRREEALAASRAGRAVTLEQETWALLERLSKGDQALWPGLIAEAVRAYAHGR